MVDLLTPVSRFSDVLKKSASGICVSGPAVVTAVTGSSNGVRLTVRPEIASQDSDGGYHSFPEIKDVPLIQPGGGGFSVEITPGVGDVVWLNFSDRSLDEWKQGASSDKPASKRTHALADAVAFPTSFGSSGVTSIRVGAVNGTPALTIDSLGVTVDGNLYVTGLVQGGTLTSATTVTLNTHTHPAGTPNTGVPNPG